MTALITGATGNIGRRLVNDLLRRGVGVRALSRDPARADLPVGVGVVEGSLGSVPPAAFDEVDSVFVFPAEEGIETFVDGAVSAGVSRFVVLSSLAVSGRNERDAGSASALHHRVIEDAVTSRTDDYTILRPGNLATNLLFWGFPIRSGYPVRIPYPDSSQVLLHEADVAAVAAIALTAAERVGQVVELTGPASLTKVEQLATISAAIGRDVPYVEISAEEFRAEMAQYMPADIVEMLLRYWSDTLTQPEAPLAAPLGITATPLSQWAIDHRGAFTD
jgi:uncharacterized protein YbjT (DUF2867 family)